MLSEKCGGLGRRQAGLAEPSIDLVVPLPRRAHDADLAGQLVLLGRVESGEFGGDFAPLEVLLRLARSTGSVRRRRLSPDVTPVVTVVGRGRHRMSPGS